MPAHNIFGSRWYGIEAGTGREIWRQRVERYNFQRCLTTEYLVLSGWADLMVLSTQTGEIIWSTGSVARSATCNDEVVFSSNAARDSITAFNLATGQRLWSGTKPRQNFISVVVYNPDAEELIADGAVIVNPSSGEHSSLF